MPMLPVRRTLLVLALALLLPACGGGGEAAAPQASPALAVTVVSPQVREVERAIAVSGAVAAVEEMQLGVEVGGLRVTGLYVDVGQFVRRGQVLLELDARTLDSDLAQARAALNEAQAGAGLAQANLRRAEPLAAGRYISAGQLDELRAARNQANARVATARAALDAAQLRRDFATLRAPDDGVISKRLVQPGQVVAGGTELLRLIRDGRLEWRAELAEAELAQVNEGDPVVVAARGGAVEGQVRAVAPGVDTSTRTGTVYADLPDPDGLQAGAYVPGRILVGAANALVLPASAVVTRDGNSYVFTVDARNVARRVRVQAGQSAQGRIEILGGVAAGTRVIDRGAGFVGDGDPVRVVPATDATAPKAPTP